MNKENNSHLFKVTSSNSMRVQPKNPMSLSAQAMPHKSIDLNSSKKASVQSSPYQQSQDRNIPLQQQSPSVQPWQAVTTSKQQEATTHNSAGTGGAGMLQKLFLEQKKLQKGDEQSPSGVGEGNSGFKPAVGGATAGGVTEFDNSVSKQLTSETVVDDHGASRRFSMFSKSSFATSSSFLFGTRILNKSSIAATKSTPKVNISSIFKNKAYLYLDEALISTFDDLLDKGHSIVTQRKEERDILTSMEVAMKGEAQELEKEIVPLIQRMNVCSEQIAHQSGLQAQYEREIAVLVEDLSNLKASIYSREQEISEAHSDLTNTIKQMEINNNEIRSDIYINKACHRQEANQQAIHKKQKQAEMDELTKQLIGLKAEYEQKKLAQADRLRKMENKQKMFMGILKH